MRQSSVPRRRSHPFVDGPRAGGPSSLGTTEDDAAICYLQIDPRFARQDLDCVLPLRRLQLLYANGTAGGVATTHYSYMGFIPHPPQLPAATVSAITAGRAEETVDVAVLVPVRPVCCRPTGLVRQVIEASGVCR